MNYPPPQQQPPLQPIKKKGGGCLLALAIVGGVMVLIGIVVMVVAWKVVSSPAGQSAIEATKAAAAGMNAPGTPELRALGCNQALVIDASKLEAVAKQLIDASREAPPRTYGLQVMCITNAREGTPTCQQVAETYQAAVKTPASSYAVTVSVQGANRPDCTVIYGADGVRLRAE